MKQTLLLFSFLTIIIGSNAQLVKKPAPVNNFSDSLQKIILAYKTNFQLIQGGRLPAETEADAYRSKAGLPGASNCKILRYRSAEDHSASWQCTVYKGDSYPEAVKMYTKTFAQVKQTKVKGIDAAGNTFTGQLDPSDESLRFAVSSLRIKTTNKIYQNFVADVELVSNYTGWAVHLNIYSKSLEAADEDEDNTQ